MYLNSSNFHIGVSNPRADLPEVLKLVEKGLFKPEKVTTLVADGSDSVDAFLAWPRLISARRSRLCRGRGVAIIETVDRE